MFTFRGAEENCDLGNPIYLWKGGRDCRSYDRGYYDFDSMNTVRVQSKMYGFKGTSEWWVFTTPKGTGHYEEEGDYGEDDEEADEPATNQIAQ